MLARLIKHKMNQINKLYANKYRIECIDLFENHYAIVWNYNGHKWRTKYEGSEYECYQFLRAFLLERRVRVYRLPIYHSRPMKALRRLPKISKTAKEFLVDFLAVGCMFLAITGLAFIL
ncbi:MAG: hypothetical protein LIO87_08765 [Eubacterium sp.]|nr:hypothetical protein [Eubacterium sp.]